MIRWNNEIGDWKRTRVQVLTPSTETFRPLETHDRSELETVNLIRGLLPPFYPPNLHSIVIRTEAAIPAWDGLLSSMLALGHVGVAEAAPAGDIDLVPSMLLAGLNGHILWFGSDLADWPSGDVVILVVGDDRGMLDLSVVELHATLEGLEELSNSFVVVWDFNVHSLVALSVD